MDMDSYGIKIAQVQGFGQRPGGRTLDVREGVWKPGVFSLTPPCYPWLKNHPKNGEGLGIWGSWDIMGCIWMDSAQKKGEEADRNIFRCGRV
jgi:hypothetical protein